MTARRPVASASNTASVLPSLSTSSHAWPSNVCCVRSCPGRILPYERRCPSVSSQNNSASSLVWFTNVMEVSSPVRRDRRGTRLPCLAGNGASGCSSASTTPESIRKLQRLPDKRNRTRDPSASNRIPSGDSPSPGALPASLPTDSRTRPMSIKGARSPVVAFTRTNSAVPGPVSTRYQKLEGLNHSGWMRERNTLFSVRCARPMARS